MDEDPGKRFGARLYLNIPEGSKSLLLETSSGFRSKEGGEEY